jgi:hypothetical protein
MEYSLPQFLEIKPKVAGPLTFRQLIYIGSAGIFLAIAFTMLPLWKFFLVAVFVGGIAVFLAFGKIKGFPAPTILARAFSFLFVNKIYIWQKKEIPPTVLPSKEKKKKEEEKVPGATLRIAEGSRLKKLVNIIEIHR